MTDKLYPEICCLHRNFRGERICGDTSARKFFGSENRTVLVLSDGMGHGVKANVLSTLTASMMVNFADAKKDIRQIARIVLNNLPVCSIRKISYSTFSVVDMAHSTNEVTLAEHDNPPAVIVRDGKILTLPRTSFLIKENPNRPQQVFTTGFTVETGDRILLMTDGVTQSGLGSREYPFGWGYRNVMDWIEECLRHDPEIPSDELARRLSDAAVEKDGGFPKDDVSVVAIRFRPPVRTMIVCGIPGGGRENRWKFFSEVKNFDGKKLIFGKETTGFLSEYDPEQFPPALFGKKHTAGPDFLATAGYGGPLRELVRMLAGAEGRPADEFISQLFRMLTDSDEVVFLVGDKDFGIGGYDRPFEESDNRKTIGSLFELLADRYKKAVSIHVI